jgi:phosphoglycerol transferase MdoB-like AlkP superfamily enzyme
MFFAHRTRQRILIALAACIAYALLVAAAAAIFPRDGKSFASSFGWWLLAIPVGLVAYAALELIGTWSLGLSFWQRMPSWARVLLLVVVISLGAVGAIFVNQYVGGSIAL